MKKLPRILCVILLVFGFVGNAGATVINAEGTVTEMDSYIYKPIGDELGSASAVLRHGTYWYWSFEDLEMNVSQLDIVFHNTYNRGSLNDTLNVYLIDADNNTPIPDLQDGLAQYRDGWWSSDWPGIPDWDNWYHIGTWSDDNDSPWNRHDICYTITDQDILQAVSNGYRFVVGIDPDCKYKGTGIGTYTCPAPVPEPSTLLLLGTGLIGLAGKRMKNRLKM